MTTPGLSAASVKRGGTVSIRFKIKDPAPNAGWASLTVKVRKLNGKLVGTYKSARVDVNKALSLPVHCTLPRGRYRFSVCAKDAAGNAQSKAGSNLLTVR